MKLTVKLKLFKSEMRFFVIFLVLQRLSACKTNPQVSIRPKPTFSIPSLPTEGSGEFFDEMMMDFGSISAEYNALNTFGYSLVLLFMI